MFCTQGDLTQIFPTFTNLIVSLDFHIKTDHEPFLSALQNMGVEFLHGAENFRQSKVLFVQAAYNFLQAAIVHFMQLYPEFFFRYLYKNFQKMPLMKNS